MLLLLFGAMISIQSYAADSEEFSEKRSELLDSIGRLRLEKNFERSLDFANQLIEIEMQGNDNNAILTAFTIKAEILNELNRINEAFRLCLELDKTFCSSESNSSNCAECQRLFLNLSSFMETMQNYRSALGYLDRICESEMESKIYYLKARVYHRLENTDSALYTTQLGIDKLIAKGDIKEIILAYNNHGLTARRIGQYERAIEAFESALHVADTSGLVDAKYGVIIGNIGSCYHSMGEIEKSYEYLLIDAHQSKISNTIESYINASLLLAEIDLSQGNYHRAELRVDTLFTEYKNEMFQRHIIRAYKVLTDAYEALGQDKKYQEASSNWTTLLEEDYSQKMEAQRQLVAEYAANNLRQITVQIENEKKLQELQMENRLQEEEQQRYMLYGSLSFFVVLAGFIFRSYYRKRKDNKLISAQKEKVEDQQKKIVESINYAKRIQTSILPDLEEIGKKLPTFEVLYKPRDIVSGDFFWHIDVDGKQYIIIGDCTGHGVPGGFMTMLGVSALKEVIIGEGLTKADEILENLDKKIIDLLSQHSRHSTDDGMEMAILIVDNQKEELTYCGANINMYNVNGSTETISATRRGIGGWFPKRDRLPQFESHVFDFKNLGTIYLTTDGLEDQFEEGGRSKFGRDRFLAELTDSADSNRLDSLDNKLSQWQGKSRQTDDICVISLSFEK